MAFPKSRGTRISRRYSTSTATRLLCVGAQVDGGFANAVINLLVDGAHRFVAPSYGYDVLPVLGHALHARTRRRWRRWTVTVGLGIALVFFAGSMATGLVGLLVWLWLAWAVSFVDRLMVLSALTNHLLPPERAAAGAAFDGGIPHHDFLTRRTIKRIAEEQDNANEVVFYGGYRPFVGAGELVSSENFPIMLNGAPTGLSISGEPTPLKPVKQFTPADMMEYVTNRLRAVLQTDEVIGRSISDLNIKRRRYRTAVGPRRPEPGSAAAVAAARDEGYDASREYLCVRVGTWNQELVSTLFVTFDVRGSTLYTELHSYLLHPLKRGYHQADLLPGEITGRDVAALAVSSIGGMIVTAVTSSVFFVTLPFRIFSLARRTDGEQPPRQPVDPLLELPVTRQAVGDFGALVSVRELAAINGHHHFFQAVDAVKYAKIVERRLLEIAIDYLTERDVDTSEYRAKQMAILNYGIMQTGGGHISNTGVLAMGPNATASGK